jgi:hypothetical protein
MIRRLQSAILGAAFLGALGLSADVAAKPPDLPLDETITVKARVKPPVEEPIQPRESPPLSGGAIVPTPEAEPPALPRVEPTQPQPVFIKVNETKTGSLLFGVGVNSSSGLTGSIVVNERNFDCRKLPIPEIYLLRPTARRMLAGSFLFGVHPLLAFVPIAKLLDAPCDHPQPVNKEEDVLAKYPKGNSDAVLNAAGCAGTFGGHSCQEPEPEKIDCIKLYLTQRDDTPAAEQHEGYVCLCGTEAEPEELPMPREESVADADGITCPYLRQQRMDRHACQMADAEIGRDVLDNLKRLQQAENLLNLARQLAQQGNLQAAKECSICAQEMCPGSPCAERAIEITKDILVEMILDPAKLMGKAIEETCEPEADAGNKEPSVKVMVDGLMKACYLLVGQGMHMQAAELARQAYALDPQRVMADPLMYKMHLLSETPVHQPAGATEESEPPTCPYCPSAGKPIRAIVPAKKKKEPKPTTLLIPALPPIDYEVVPALERTVTESHKVGTEEASEEGVPSCVRELVDAISGAHGQAMLGIGASSDGNLHVEGECSLGGKVYHVRYSNGCLAIWNTTDASKTKP